MSFDIRDNDNLFAAPVARIGASDVDLVETIPDAEAIRQAHIGHEKSIKALGMLQYLGSFFCTLGTIGIAVVLGFVVATGTPPGGRGNMGPAEMITLGFGLAFYLFLAVLAGALGLGLRRLQPWSRWTMLVLTAISLILTLASGAITLVAAPNAVAGGAIGAISLIYGYFLYLLAAPKAGMVFSREYKAIILQTPFVKNRTTLAVKLIVVAIFTAIALGVIFLMSWGR